MRFPAILMAAATQGSGRDPDLAAWMAAVVANGGTVSASRAAIVGQFISAEKAAGCWALTDDYWALWAESAVQALTSLKQRRLGTAANAPTFTTDRGYTFNGTTQRIDTGFNTSTNVVVLAVTNARIAAYERTDAASGSAAGALGSGNNIIIARPRTAANVATLYAMSEAHTYTLPSGDSRGFTAGSRSGSACAAYKNGVALAPIATTALGVALPNVNLFIGAQSAAGGFRASQVGFVAIGGALTAAQELAQYNDVQAFATAVGAQV